ncbi:MAG TPA: alanyl-tRNA editing protein [Alphaproteobacteria bacterium]
MTQKLFIEDAQIRDFEAVVTHLAPEGVILDQTAFYATSGGQPGDIGILNGVPVTNTIKSKEIADAIIHCADPALFTVGQKVQGQIDWGRRLRHMRMHTTLHLVCSLIKGYATGNQINADKSRIDFDVDMQDLDKDKLTAQLNALIAGAHPITTGWIDEEELDRNPELVRTLSVQPPRGTGKIRMVTIGDIAAPVDRQPCGGTHVANTNDIGLVTVTKIENKGKMNKRLIIELAA